MTWLTVEEFQLMLKAVYMMENGLKTKPVDLENIKVMMVYIMRDSGWRINNMGLEKKLI